MAETAGKASHKWSPDETRRLIRFREEHEQRFLKSKASAKQLWETLIKDLGLQGKVTSQQASKKWENLKKKYKELKTPKTGSGTDCGETTASTWQFYEDMHAVLGARPSIDPPVVVASFNAQDTDEPSCSASVTASPSPSPPPPPQKKMKANPVVEFLQQESAKEQKRHEETEEKTDRFLFLFERMVEKL